MFWKSLDTRPRSICTCDDVGGRRSVFEIMEVVGGSPSQRQPALRDLLVARLSSLQRPLVRFFGRIGDL